MVLSNEEKKFIESLSNISGVNKESIEKVFSAYVLFIVLEFYDKLEDYYDDNVLIDETIEMKLPFILENMSIRIKEKEDKGGIGFDTFFSGKLHEYLAKNIHQLLINEDPDIKEKLKLEIFNGLQKIVGGN